MLGERPRKIVDDKEWEWITEHADGDFDHYCFVDTLPFLLVPALHHVEAWNEAVCAGRVGGAGGAGIGERIRRALDLEHWAAFNESFRRMVRLIGEIASGRRGSPPATIIAIGGDVHHAYLAEVAFPRERAACRAPSTRRSARRFATRSTHGASAGSCNAAASRDGARCTRLLARAAGVPDPEISWRLAQSADLRQPVRDARARRSQRACCGSSAPCATRPTTAASRRRSSGGSRSCSRFALR